MPYETKARALERGEIMDKNNDNDNEPIHVLNLGAGVQSSCMALMASKGEITPMPVAGIFADTQAEPQSVYDWIGYLESQLSFPVIRVSKGSLTEASLRHHFRPAPRDKETYMRRLIPLFGLMPDGTKTAVIGRKCTSDYKIKPIISELRKRFNIKRGQKEQSIVQWIGISMDEIQRMKESDLPWTKHRWPLIEKRMTRGHCLDWMKDNGYPAPPRSACFYCPFHSNAEWRNLRNNDPLHFLKAIEFEQEIKDAYDKHEPTLIMDVFLHPSCVPLGEIDFDNDEDKGQMTWDFNSECEGMCGL